MRSSKTRLVPAVRRLVKSEPVAKATTAITEALNRLIVMAADFYQCDPFPGYDSTMHRRDFIPAMAAAAVAAAQTPAPAPMVRKGRLKQVPRGGAAGRFGV
jgi:hypothetical protein